MRRGKHICETLKGIRSEIAQANGIEYRPEECHHEGDCAGTCPKCESETRWLERQLSIRRKLGKAVTIAGLSVALGTTATSCDMAERVHEKVLETFNNIRPDDTEGEVPDTMRLEGEVAVDDSLMCQPGNEIIDKNE